MHDVAAKVALGLAVIVVAAKLAGDLAVRLGQAAVLGEIVVGVLLGALPPVSGLAHDPGIDLVARIGAMILLFEVGLDLTVRDVVAVGRAAVVSGVLGSAASFVLGAAASYAVRPHAGAHVHAFVGAACTATSVGISARVLKDLDRAKSLEARVILGAAVVDDVVGLVALAIVTGAFAALSGSGAKLDAGTVLLTIGKAVGFLAAAVALGVKVTPRIFAFAARLRTNGALVAAGFAFCFVLAWAADAIGLAPIVGAFAAGLVIEDKHSARFVARGERALGELVEPVSSFLVPVFFVLMGMRVDVRALASGGHVGAALGAALVLTVGAVLGKGACAAGAPKGARRRVIAAGMIPRGEVTLIYASLGGSLIVAGTPVLDASLYSALVLVVIVTTLVTPTALKASFA